MKKSKLTAAALLASMLVLSGCGPEKPKCSHVDASPADHKCDLCGETMSEHSFGEVTVSKAPTCTEEGKGTKECSICHEVVEVAIPALGHGVSFVPAVAPSCSKAGVLAHYECSREPGVYYEDEACTKVMSSIVAPALGHQVSHVEAVAPTCTKAGVLAHYECAHEPGVYYEDEACTKVMSSIVGEAALGHEVTHVPASEATCTKAGVLEHYECSREPGVYYEDEACTKVMSSIVGKSAIGHDVSFVSAVAPSCTKPGVLAHYECAHEPGVYYEDEACTKVMASVVDPALGHDASHIEAVGPTCTEAGVLEHYECSREPGVYYEDEDCSVVMPSIVGEAATGHSFTGGYEKSATEHWIPCDHDCGEKSMVESHVYTAWAVKTAPTYEAKGVEERHCKVCGYEETREISMLEHHFSKDLFQGEDTHYYKCLDAGCEEKKDEASHSFGEFSVVKEATYEEAGLKQKVCSECGKVISEVIPKKEHSFSENFSSNLTQHWHACTEEGCQEKSGLEDHIDVDEDGVCDVCGKTGLEPGFVTSITVSCPLTEIGDGESVLVRANVSKLGVCGDELDWTILKNGEPIDDGNFEFEVVDKYTIRLYATFTTNTSFTRKIRASLKDDPTTYGEFQIVGWYQNRDRISTLKSFLGSDYEFPYNYAYRPSGNGMFYVDGDACYGYAPSSYKTGGVTYQVMPRFVAGFRNIGHFTESEEDGVYTFVKRSKDNTFDIKYVISEIAGNVYVDCYKVYDYLESFPMEVAKANVRGMIGCDIIAPASADSYLVSGSTITVFGYADEYIEQLKSAGYLSKVQSLKTTLVSPDGSLQVVVNDKGTSYTLAFSALSIPCGTDWSAADKEMMMSFVGEVIPFVNYNYSKFYDYIEYGGYIYATSSRIGAQLVAKAVFDEEPTFEASFSSNIYYYEKPIDKFTKMVVEVLSSGQINIMKEQASLETWEAEEIAAHIGKEAKEVLPEASTEGNTFKYEFGEESVVITVTHPDSVTMIDYCEILEEAGFTTSDTGYTRVYISPSDTLRVTVSRTTNGSKTFKITPEAKLPEGVSYEFPMEKVVGHLHKEIDATGIPTPVGSLFRFSEISKYQTEVTVMEGGSMSGYAEALVAKSFELVGSVYKNGNICVELTAGEEGAFTAKFYLAEEPAAPDFVDLTEALAFAEFTKELPAPSVFESATEPVYDSYLESYSMVVTTSLSLAEYAEELSNAGFGVEEGWYDDYYIYETPGVYEAGYLCIYVAEAGSICIDFYAPYVY